MGGGESRNSQLAKYGNSLSQLERETLQKLFRNIVQSGEANSLTSEQFQVRCSLYFGYTLSYL